MLGDSTSKSSSGLISLGLEVDTSVLAVLNFLEKNLSNFTIKNKGLINHNEEGLTEKLIIYLERKRITEPFLFFNEKKEDNSYGGSPRVDIGVLSKSQTITVKDTTYGEDDAFFKIEAKRLSNLGKARRQEYLIGRYDDEKYRNTGGVERFKKGIHGRKLHYGGMIGYVQRESFEHWFSTINTWIDQLIVEKPKFWTTKDKLKKEYAKKHIAKYYSLNLRQFEPKVDDILLFHYWIDLT